MCQEKEGGIIIMDFREIQEMQKINRLKSENDCLICEVVVPKELKHAPMSITYGDGGSIEMAMLIKCLEDVISCLKRNFPETEEIIPLLKNQGGMKEAYKKIQTTRRF